MEKLNAISRFGNIFVGLAAILGETGFPSAYLELELTESTFMVREPEVVQILKYLRALGIRPSRI